MFSLKNPQVKSFHQPNISRNFSHSFTFLNIPIEDITFVKLSSPAVSLLLLSLIWPDSHSYSPADVELYSHHGISCISQFLLTRYKGLPGFWTVHTTIHLCQLFPFCEPSGTPFTSHSAHTTKLSSIQSQQNMETKIWGSTLRPMAGRRRAKREWHKLLGH